MGKETNLDINQIEILRDMRKINNSKFKDVFKMMNEYYMRYLEIVEAMYKGKKDTKKELTMKYIFHITMLYNEILKNIYINNQISMYILSRTLVESSVKFIFIQRNDLKISEIFKDCEDAITGRYKMADFNKKYNENIKYAFDNFGIDICLKKINFKTNKKGISAIIEFIINKEPNYKLLLKNYKKYCKNIHVNIQSIQCNVCNYQSGKNGKYDYILNIILLLNYTLYNIVYELYHGQYKNYIDFQKYKSFDRQYHDIGDKLLEIY